MVNKPNLGDLFQVVTAALIKMLAVLMDLNTGTKDQVSISMKSLLDSLCHQKATCSTIPFLPTLKTAAREAHGDG